MQGWEGSCGGGSTSSHRQPSALLLRSREGTRALVGCEPRIAGELSDAVAWLGQSVVPSSEATALEASRLSPSFPLSRRMVVNIGGAGWGW